MNHYEHQRLVHLLEQRGVLLKKMGGARSRRLMESYRARLDELSRVLRPLLNARLKWNLQQQEAMRAKMRRARTRKEVFRVELDELRREAEAIINTMLHGQTRH